MEQETSQVAAVNELNDQGVALCSQKHFTDAIDCFDKVLSLDPNNARAYNNKGNALKELGQLNSAIECYERAISLNPDYANAYHNLGATYKQMGDLSRAIPLLKKGIKLSAKRTNSNPKMANEQTAPVVRKVETKYLIMFGLFLWLLILILRARS